jgi:hypothetical protein
MNRTSPRLRNQKERSMDDHRREKLVKRLMKDVPRAGDGKKLQHGKKVNDEPETKVDKAGIDKARFELLAANLWAKLGDANAVVEETNPKELTIRSGDLSWVLTLKDDGRISVSGFDSGVEQYLGKIPGEDAELALLEIANNALELIQEDIEENQAPPEEPVHFGPEDEEEDIEGFEDSETEQFGEEEPEMRDEDLPPPPETGMGDMGADPGMGMSPDPMQGGMDTMPPDPMQDPMMQTQAPMQGGMAPPMDPMMQQPMQPQPMGPMNQMAPPPMPMGNRRRPNSNQVGRRVRTAAIKRVSSVLDGVADGLQKISEMLEEKDSGAFLDLAARIDLVNNTIENE